jgi:hypothetical protein
VPSVKKDAAENIFIFHPENTMYNVSAEGTFEKREIKKIVSNYSRVPSVKKDA